MSTSEELLDIQEYVRKYSWLIRPCEDYKAEASACKKFKSRFHQYFLNGTFTDCSVWTRGVKNCRLCHDEHNNVACSDLIKSEAERRLKRLQGQKNNDVWQKRDEPPTDWNKPLPEWMLKSSKNSLFKSSQKEVEDYIANNEPVGDYKLCIIL